MSPAEGARADAIGRALDAATDEAARLGLLTTMHAVRTARYVLERERAEP